MDKVKRARNQSHKWWITIPHRNSQIYMMQSTDMHILIAWKWWKETLECYRAHFHNVAWSKEDLCSKLCKLTSEIREIDMAWLKSQKIIGQGTGEPPISESHQPPSGMPQCKVQQRHQFHNAAEFQRIFSVMEKPPPFSFLFSFLLTLA